MRFAVISDLHLGDPQCTLATKEVKQDPKDGKNLEAFLAAIGKDNDFVIILGDLLDFAINGYSDVYAIARHFFKRLKHSGALKPDGSIVYSPGNHDYDIWHTIEYEANIINQMKDGQLPRQFRMSVPLIIDDRSQSDNFFYLHGVKPQNGPQPYGGMFLDNIISKDDPINFIIPFPNIYFVNDESSTLMTHGQYFESYWTIASELFDVVTQFKGTMSMKDFISVNFPLGQLGSSGVGQDGPLTDVILKIEKDVSSGSCKLTKQYISRLVDEFLKHYDIPYVPKFAERLCLEALSNQIIKSLKRVRNSDFMNDLKSDQATQNRVTKFLNSTFVEFNDIQSNLQTQYKPLDTLLFGHTHQPVVNSDKAVFKYQGKSLKLLNTGGWLSVAPNDASKYGGEIFLYQSGQGFTSKKIPV